jgi:hypothetical protein
LSIEFSSHIPFKHWNSLVGMKLWSSTDIQSHSHAHTLYHTPRTTYHTPHTTYFTPHITHHTPHATHHIPHTILHTTNHTPHTTHYTPHTVFSILYTTPSTLYTFHSELLCKDDGAPTSLLSCPIKLPTSPYKRPFIRTNITRSAENCIINMN